jgi:hypothetical protein
MHFRALADTLAPNSRRTACVFKTSGQRNFTVCWCYFSRAVVSQNRGSMAASKVCQWAGCHYSGDAVLEGRVLCRDHFHQSVLKKLTQYQSRLREANESEIERGALIRFVSEVISQTTLLVSRTKFLSDAQRDVFLRLSHSSLDFYKRVQRDPRQDKSLPVLLSRRLSGKSTDRETTETVNVSVKGACVTSSLAWELGDRLTITRLDTKASASAQVAHIDKANGISKIGIQIIDADDFWRLKEKVSNARVSTPLESKAYKTAR